MVQTVLASLGNYTDFVDIDPRRSLERFMKAARRDAGLARLKHRFAEADMVVINGEGSMVFRRPPRRDLNFQMFAVELATELGKPVCYINALASDCPSTGGNPEVEDAVRTSLTKCAVVAARDPVSLERLHKLGLDSVVLTPDAMYTWSQRYSAFLASPTLQKTPELFDSWPESDRFHQGWTDWPADYVCLGGASRYPHQDMSDWPAFVESLVRQITKNLGLPIVLIDSGGDDFLNVVAQRTGGILIRPPINLLIATHILANARALVSGRFHPSIMASLGGTPCTFLECGAHKTLSLQQQLEYPRSRVFRFDSSPENVAMVIDDLEAQLGEGDTRRGRIRDVAARLGEEASKGISMTMERLVGLTR